MIWIQSIALLLLTFSLKASPVHFIFEDSNEIKKRVVACADFEKKKGFQFKDKHFDPREFEQASKEISQAAKTSSSERVAQLKCVLKQKLTETDREALSKSLELYKENFLNLFDYYNRWLFSFEKTNLMAPMDNKYTSEHLTLKYDLYSLLHTKTSDILLTKDSIEKEDWDAFESQITSIYLSILKGNFEYYNTINPELRKEILKRISD